MMVRRSFMAAVMITVALLCSMIMISADTSSTEAATPTPAPTMWRQYGVHRRNVMALIRTLTMPTTTAATSAADRHLAILGAGLCNDIVLSTLTNAIDNGGKSGSTGNGNNGGMGLTSVHLVDINGGDMTRAIIRQQQTRNDKIATHIVDVSGIYECLNMLQSSSSAGAPPLAVDNEGVERCTTASRSFQLRHGRLSAPGIDNSRAIPGASAIVKSSWSTLRGPYTYVVSSCIISQLIPGWMIAGDARHQLTLAARATHIRILTELVAPLGRGVLITDVVAVHTLPSRPSWADDDIESLADMTAINHWLQSNNIASYYYDTLTPASLLSLLQSSLLVSSASIIPHVWWWHASQHQQYLVMALTFERNARAASSLSSANTRVGMMTIDDFLQS
jgi:hypothetical protein